MAEVDFVAVVGADAGGVGGVFGGEVETGGTAAAVDGACRVGEGEGEGAQGCEDGWEVRVHGC